MALAGSRHALACFCAGACGMRVPVTIDSGGGGKKNGWSRQVSKRAEGKANYKKKTRAETGERDEDPIGADH